MLKESLGVCTKCRENFTVTLLMHIEPCQHKICKICIHDWHHLYHSPTCPVCQAALSSQQFFQIDQHHSQHKHSDTIAKTYHAAGGILVRSVDNVPHYLALLQKRDHGELQWISPKGIIETHEHSLAAATREIEEETGLKSLTLMDFIYKQNYCFKENQNSYNKFIFWYLFKVEQPDELNLNRAEGFIMSQWLTYDQAQHSFTHETFRQILARAHHIWQNGI